MSIKIKHNPLNLAKKLPLYGFYSTMHHLAAMLDGAIYRQGKDKDNNDIVHFQHGATDCIFPAKDIKYLLIQIFNNPKATIVFTTIGLPLTIILLALQITLNAVKSVINTTLLHLLTPVAAIIGLITKQLAKNKGMPFGILTNDDVCTILDNKLIPPLENPTRHLGINKSGFRGTKLLTPTYHERILDTLNLTNKIFRVPTLYIDRMMAEIDSNSTLRKNQLVPFSAKIIC